MRATNLLIPLVFLGAVAPARAASFVVTIKNTSQEYMAPGLLTLSPLINIGPAPNPGTKQFYTYEYSKIDCELPDSICPAGSDFTCYFGNETTLISRYGLINNVNVWVPAPPSTLLTWKVFAPGDSASIVITAQPGQRLSYISKAGDFNTYVDQIVMMHASGNPADLTVPLFDASGLPLTNITFDLGGYSVSSSSPTNGNSPECANQCPAANGQTTGCYVALGSAATGPLLPAQPTPSQLSLAWTYSAPAGYTTDAMALGNLTSSTGNELIVSMEGGAAASNPTGVGRAVVLSASNGAALSQFNGLVAGNDFMGFPMIEDLSLPLDGVGEYMVSEFGQSTPLPGAAVYARSGDSATAKWTSTGYGYPGSWNMGPSAADVRTDGSNSGNEVVIADYNGDIVVLKRDTAATLNKYNLFASNGENIYGHAVVANVHTNPGNEIVVVGAKTGKAYVFGAATTGAAPQALNLLYTSNAPLNGGYAFGSGAAVADLDGDGSNEIIVATAGGGAVYAYNSAAGAGCVYKWSTPGGFDYSWSSPVVGDVDGDGKPEIVVFSSDSVLSVLEVPTKHAGSCTEGTVAWKYTVGNGGPAWFTPALADVTGTGALDIVVANYQTLEVLDANLQRTAWRYNDPSAQFYPTALVERGTSGGPGAGIYVPGWSNGKVLKLTTPTGSKLPPVDWPTFMGANTRSGSR